VALQRKNGQPIDDVVMSDSTSDSTDSDSTTHVGSSAKQKPIIYGSSLRQHSGRAHKQTLDADSTKERHAAGIDSTDCHTASGDREPPTVSDSLHEAPTHGIFFKDKDIKIRNIDPRTMGAIEDTEADDYSGDDNYR
jgi:hypothetical protein